VPPHNRVPVAPPPLFAQQCSLGVLSHLFRDGKTNLRLLARKPSLPCVAIPFNLTPFPLTLLNGLLFNFLKRVSVAEGERYGNSTRRCSTLCLREDRARTCPDRRPRRVCCPLRASRLGRHLVAPAARRPTVARRSPKRKTSLLSRAKFVHRTTR
jgi:hypothetical protein